MKTHIITLLLALLPVFAAAQDEPAGHSEAAAQFVEYYNNNDHAAFFGMFDDVMKKAVDAEKTAELFAGMHVQFGKLDKLEFIRIDSGSGTGFYKATFKKSLLTLTISLDSTGKIAGFYIRPYTGGKTYAERQAEHSLARNNTPMSLPFHEECFVFWGGDTVAENYHVSFPPQKHAFDFLMTGDNGLSFRTDGLTNDDYYIFGIELTAPCDGEVVMAVDGIPDNQPGVTNPLMAFGNSVIIKVSKDEYLVFAHFKNGTVAVREGETVTRGQLLGLCGNSGNSTEAHLHFHIQDGPDLQNSTGVKCFFENVTINGERLLDYSPVKGDRVSR